MKPQATLFAACFLSAGLITPCLNAQSFRFTTIAGGSPGYLDDINSNAQFNSPTGVAVDGSGNVYVADQGNNAIRKITPSGTNWIVTTIAGGTQGSEDGTNTGAQFFGPAGIAVDTTGKLYVTDQYNGTIRQITPLGTNWVVSTIAGSVGLSGSHDGTNAGAEFSDPAGIAVDGSGNIFVADEANNAVREIIPSGGNWIVSTIAGGSRGSSDGVNSAAQFFGPSGVAVDGSGRVFVADQFNNTIRLINPVGSNWVVTTIAGQSVAGRSDGSGSNARFNAPINLAVDASDNLYVADLFNDAIRKMTLVGTAWMVTTIAGGSAGSSSGAGTNAQFNLPFDVATDAFGDVFVADSQNNAVRLGAAAGSPPPTGGVAVAITPANAVSAGARWLLDGGAHQTNGAILSGLMPGNHTVSFTTVSGFTTPAPQTIALTARQTAQVTGDYTAAVANAGALQVLISPAGAANAGAQWQVGSGAWQTNGAIVSGLSAGVHTVSFSVTPGWTTPASLDLTITNHQTTVVRGTYVLQAGSLQVTLLPAAAVSAGAQWQVDGGTFYGSGTTVSGLSPGSHTVEFKTTLGWTTPVNQQVTITNGQTTAETEVYVQRNAGAGALQVTLLPGNAINAGAQWQVDGSAPQPSGAIVSNLTAGLHSLTFTTVPGFFPPPNQIVTISEGQTNSASGTYLANIGLLQVTITPAGAVAAGAQWRVDGGAFQASGASVSGLAPGMHTVAFNVVHGWIPPVQQAVTISESQGATLTGAYRAGTDTIKPLLAITNGPRPNAVVTNPLAVMEGWASDNIAVDQVFFELNGGGYQPATGTTHWSASLTLVPGTNIFAVKATDASGNVSLVLGRTFHFIVPSPLTVTTIGSGKITPALNGHLLEVGMPYLLTAAPNPGNLFSNWSGSLSSSNPALHFIMQSNLVLQANFVPNPFIPQEGGFSGLFYDTNGVARQSSGFFHLTLMSNGVFSAGIQIGGGSFSASGQFDLTGHAQLTIPRLHATPLTADLQLDFSNHLSGAISDGTWNAVLNASRAVFNAVNNRATNYLGQYTMAIAGGDGVVSPGGEGYATFSVNAAGVIVMGGSLADGTAISQSVALSGDGQWPLYVALPNGGSVLSWITFSNQPAATLGGALMWIRPAGPTPGLYRAGFTNLTFVTGSRYGETNGVPVLTLNNGQAVLSGPSLAASLTNGVSVNANNTLQVGAGAEHLSLILTNRATGLIIGSFRFPGTGAVTPVRGVILQEQGQAQGYFLGAGQSDEFLIESQ